MAFQQPDGSTVALNRTIDGVRISRDGANVVIRESRMVSYLVFLFGALAVGGLGALCIYWFGRPTDGFQFTVVGVVFGGPILLLAIGLLPWSVAMVLDGNVNTVEFRKQFFGWGYRKQIFSLAGSRIVGTTRLQEHKRDHSSAAVTKHVGFKVVEIFHKPVFSIAVVDTSRNHTTHLLSSEERQPLAQALDALKAAAPTLVDASLPEKLPVG